MHYPPSTVTLLALHTKSRNALLSGIHKYVVAIHQAHRSCKAKCGVDEVFVDVLDLIHRPSQHIGTRVNNCLAAPGTVLGGYLPFDCDSGVGREEGRKGGREGGREGRGREGGGREGGREGGGK